MEWLSHDELFELTNRSRPSAQRKVLDSMGIVYRVRPDGSVVLFRSELSNASTQTESKSPKLRLS